MKFKLYVIAMCTSMLCVSSSVYGDMPCPAPGKVAIGNLVPWQIDRSKTPTDEEFLDLFAKATFKNAWLYDANKGPAKCHYDAGGKLISL